MVKIQAIPKEIKELSLYNLGNSIKILCTTLLTLVLINVSTAQTFDKTKLDQLFDRLDEKNRAMGSLTISKEGKVLYSRSIGYRQINGTENSPITTATRFRIGSVTKMFTAAMIFLLIEEGKLELTDKLEKFYPKLPNANKITIAHILAHRSGIHDISEDRDFRNKRLEGMMKDELLTLITKSIPDFEPDSKYAYSNTGFQLLGMLLEKLTGKSYQELLTKRITSKIGLKDTYAGTGSIDAGKNESFSYRYTKNWEQQPETHISLLFGSGSLISTSGDQAKFIEALFGGKLVSKESLKRMMQDKSGIDTFTYNAKTAYGHTGGIDGFGSWLVYLPEEKLAVSYVTNGKVYPVAKLVDDVFNIYFDPSFAVPTFESITISNEVLDRYVGIYSIPGVPVKFTVLREGTILFIQMQGQSPIPLQATAEDKFKIESPEIFFEFDTEKKQMTQKRNGRERVFTKEN